MASSKAISPVSSSPPSICSPMRCPDILMGLQWHTHKRLRAHTHTQVFMGFRSSGWRILEILGQLQDAQRVLTCAFCVHALHFCVRGRATREAGRRRGGRRTLSWHAMCLNVPFSFTNPSSFFPPPSVLSEPAYWFNIRPELPSGCFSFLCFYKIGRAETWERDRRREKERTGSKIHNMLNEDSERRGECAKYTEGECETDVGLVGVVGVGNISCSCMQSKGGNCSANRRQMTSCKESSMWFGLIFFFNVGKHAEAQGTCANLPEPNFLHPLSFSVLSWFTNKNKERQTERERGKQNRLPPRETSESPPDATHLRLLRLCRFSPLPVPQELGKQTHRPATVPLSAIDFFHQCVIVWWQIFNTLAQYWSQHWVKRELRVHLSLAGSRSDLPSPVVHLAHIKIDIFQINA